MGINKLLREGLLSLLEKQEYAGEHEAPTKEYGAPLHDLTVLLPDDIYSSDAFKLYGNRDDRNHQVLSIINDLRGKPKGKVRIYRAVPDLAHEDRKRLKELTASLNYYYKFGFYQVGDELIHAIEDKYSLDDYEYNERKKLVLRDLENEVDELTQLVKKDKLGINDGDWVTLTRAYAHEHGKSNLNNKYKIVSKVVRADQVYSEANDLQEWGYSI